MINLLNIQKNKEYLQNTHNNNIANNNNNSSLNENQGNNKLYNTQQNKRQSSLGKKQQQYTTAKITQVKLINSNELPQQYSHQQMPNRGGVMSIQNIPNQVNLHRMDLPVSIVKPLKPKFERVASANFNSKVIKKLTQTNQLDNQLFQQQNNYFNEPYQNTDNDFGQQQARKFFDENTIKPQTAGAISRKVNKKSNIYQSKTKQIENQEFQHSEMGNWFEDLESKDQQIKDYKLIMENNRAKTAQGFNYNQFNNKRISHTGQEKYRPTGKGMQINKVNLEEQDVEYETFKVNKDVRSHMSKFLRPASQYNINSKKFNSNTQLSPKKYSKNKSQNNFYNKNQYVKKQKFFEDNDIQNSSMNRSRQGIKTAQPKSRRKNSLQNSQFEEIQDQFNNRPFTQQQKNSRVKKLPQPIQSAAKTVSTALPSGISRDRLQKTPQEQIQQLYNNNNIQDSTKKPPLPKNNKKLNSKTQDIENNYLSDEEQEQEDFQQTHQNQYQQEYDETNELLDLYNNKPQNQFQDQELIQNEEQDLDFQNTSEIQFDNKQGFQEFQQPVKQKNIQKKLEKQVGSVKFNVSLKKTKPQKHQSSKIEEEDQEVSKRTLNQSNLSKSIQQQNESLQKEQIDCFDVDFEGITQNELNFIEKQNKKQQEFEEKYKIKPKNSAQKRLLVVPQTNEKDEGGYDYLDDLVIEQEAVTKEVQFKEFYENNQNIRNELNELAENCKTKFVQYQQEDEKLFKQMEEEKEQQLNFMSIDDKYVSESELDYVRAQYNKPVNSRDYNILDGICSKLKFFTQFTRATRIYLLKLSNIEYFPAGQNIFEQGDEGDLMYIIIKGGCHVRIKRKNLAGEIENPVFVTLYDGTQFGELALQAQQKPAKGITATLQGEDKKVQSLKEVRQLLEEERQQKEEEMQIRKQKLREQKGEEDPDSKSAFDKMNEKQENAKRAATIETCENTWVFTVSRDQYKTIIVNMMKRDLDDKLRLLQTLSFFDTFNSVSLMTLAKHIEVQKFKLGEVILKEGTLPNYFYIISSGRVKIIKQEMFIRQNYLLGQSKKTDKKKLNFGKKDYKQVVKKGQGTNNQVFNDFEDFDEENQEDEEDEEDYKMKAEQYKKVYQNDEKCLFKYQFDFGSLARSDYFLGRSLISEYIKLDPKYEFEIGKRDVKSNARLTVIADSAEVEIYRIDKRKIYELPVYLRKVFIDGLCSKKEYDWEYDDNLKVNLDDKKVLKNEKLSFNQYMMGTFGNGWVKHWEKFKQDIIKGHLDQKQMEKNKFNN